MRWLLAAVCLSFAADAWPAERCRDFDIQAIGGAVSTRGVLRVKDETRFASGFTAKMHLVDRAGYFVDVYLVPATRPAWVNAAPGFRDVLLAYFAVGPFYKWRRGALDLTYRIGYGAVGDDRTAADLLLHGLTLRRSISGRLGATADLSQALLSLDSRGVLAMTVGLGLRL
jgi:hypothetical protein